MTIIVITSTSPSALIEALIEEHESRCFKYEVATALGLGDVLDPNFHEYAEIMGDIIKDLVDSQRPSVREEAFAAAKREESESERLDRKLYQIREDLGDSNPRRIEIVDNPDMSDEYIEELHNAVCDMYPYSEVVLVDSTEVE